MGARVWQSGRIAGDGGSAAIRHRTPAILGDERVREVEEIGQ
jgi:hypothetical protein